MPFLKPEHLVLSQCPWQEHLEISLSEWLISKCLNVSASSFTIDSEMFFIISFFSSTMSENCASVCFISVVGIKFLFYYCEYIIYMPNC